MPNWCKGNLRLRGKREAIVEFLRNELESTGYSFNDDMQTVNGPLEIIDDSYEVVVKIPNERKNLLFAAIYIKGTHRNFIDGTSFEVYGNNPEGMVVCIDGVKAAWAFDAAPYVEKAKKYGIDIRIVGFERGMEFMQEIEIVDGKIVKDAEIEFADWNWDCPMPNMGG